MNGESRRQRSRERLLRVAAAALDPIELRLEVVAELHRAIGFAYWCWTLVDPATLVPTGGMAEHLPFAPDFPRYITLVEREADVNSYRALTCRQPHRPAVGLLGAATGGALWRSVRQREVFAPAGMGDELRIVLRDGRGCWGFLNLYRAAGERTFDPDEGQLAADVAPALTAALRRSLHRGPPGWDVGDEPPGVLILDDDLRLRAQTPAARQWLAALPGAVPSAAPPLPTPVYAVAARLLGQEAGVDPHRPPRSRVRLASRRWAVLHAARLEGAGGGIAVTIEQARPSEVLDLLYQAWELSPRERALVDLVQVGLDTGQIATRLCITPHTVQDHLKAIFEKVGVHSRRELVGGLVGAVGGLVGAGCPELRPV